jgi:uncharacterized membrane protein
MVRFIKGEVEGTEIKWRRGLIDESKNAMAFIAIEEERGSGTEVTIESSRALMKVGSQGNGNGISG